MSSPLFDYGVFLRSLRVFGNVSTCGASVPAELSTKKREEAMQLTRLYTPISF